MELTGHDACGIFYRLGQSRPGRAGHAQTADQKSGVGMAIVTTPSPASTGGPVMP